MTFQNIDACSCSHEDELSISDNVKSIGKCSNKGEVQDLINNSNEIEKRRFLNPIFENDQNQTHRLESYTAAPCNGLRGISQNKGK